MTEIEDLETQVLANTKQITYLMESIRDILIMIKKLKEAKKK